MDRRHQQDRHHRQDHRHARHRRARRPPDVTDGTVSRHQRRADLRHLDEVRSPAAGCFLGVNLGPAADCAGRCREPRDAPRGYELQVLHRMGCYRRGADGELLVHLRWDAVMGSP